MRASDANPAANIGSEGGAFTTSNVTAVRLKSPSTAVKFSSGPYGRNSRWSKAWMLPVPESDGLSGTQENPVLGRSFPGTMMSSIPNRDRLSDERSSVYRPGCVSMTSALVSKVKKSPEPPKSEELTAV